MNDGITPIGTVNFRKDNRQFGIKDNDRFGHIYCIGKTGTGKSTLLLNMAVSDIKRGVGICVIDPHGDVAMTLLEHIPKNRLEQVIYFNPLDSEFPCTFNPLYSVDVVYHQIVCSGLLNTFKKIWSDSWGPRLEYILRYCILSLLEYGQGTLLDIPKMLNDTKYRNDILRHVTTPAIINFWTMEFDKYAPKFKTEAISPILNKVGVFSSSLVLRNVFGSIRPTIDLQKIMDEGYILIANLSKGRLGEDVTSLLGCILVNGVQLSAIRRASQSIEERRPFYLYVDECHSFLTTSIVDILSESRKYALGLFLANQYVEQLKEEIRSAIFGNVGTLICFRVGASDAEYLEKEFEPLIEGKDLVQLPRYSMFLKLMIDGATSLPFSAKTIKLNAPMGVDCNVVIKNSQDIFGRSMKKMPDTLYGVDIF